MCGAVDWCRVTDGEFLDDDVLGVEGVGRVEMHLAGGGLVRVDCLPVAVATGRGV